MTSSATSALQGALNALNGSAMFHLSLASRELFHSNFLAFLCERYPEDMGRILAQRMKQAPAVARVGRPLRESRNRDLVVPFGDGGQDPRLVIEVKVKSLPDLRQLERYEQQGKVSSMDEAWLLSLLPPLQDAPAKRWKHIPLKDFADQLQDELPVNGGYHRQLLDDYASMVKHLDAAANAAKVDFATDAPFYDAELRKRFEDIRLHGFFDNVRFSCLVSHLRERLGAPPSGNWYGSAGDIIVGQDISRGMGICSVTLLLEDIREESPPNPPGPPKCVLGVQVQNGELRLFSGVTGKGDVAEKKAKELKESLHKKPSWFDVGRLVEKHHDMLDPPGKNRSQDGFRNYSGKFFYRYARLKGGLAAKELADLVFTLADGMRKGYEDGNNAFDYASSLAL